MVAWAHGTSATFTPCGPSNYRSLQYHFMVPYALALQGIAVVAPDYAGLGIDLKPISPIGAPLRHQWASKANANDMAYAVTAARSAFPDMLTASGPFVAMGHSQGGRAAWRFAEEQLTYQLPGYAGTVAIAPPTTILPDFAAQLAADNSPGTSTDLLAIQPLIIDSVTALYPSYDWAGFTATARDRWHNVLRAVGGCLPTMTLALGSGSSGAGVGGSDGRWPQGVCGPLLVVNGEADATVLVNTTAKIVDDTCGMMSATGSAGSLHFTRYGGVQHFPAIQAPQGKWIQWVKDRLAGLPVDGGCTRERISGLWTDDSVQSPLPNFLLSWNTRENIWMNAL
ncbi:Alpha/Beta hydrolase protein [Xylariaceae sp. FL0016]|nr:Alpha/Beta hydrolase protein [Xylariaceae sp. FL0016]